MSPPEEGKEALPRSSPSFQLEVPKFFEPPRDVHFLPGQNLEAGPALPGLVPFHTLPLPRHHGDVPHGCLGLGVCGRLLLS